LECIETNGLRDTKVKTNTNTAEALNAASGKTKVTRCERTKHRLDAPEGLSPAPMAVATKLSPATPCAAWSIRGDALPSPYRDLAAWR
jgi:hypothetical protein